MKYRRFKVVRNFADASMDVAILDTKRGMRIPEIDQYVGFLIKGGMKPTSIGQYVFSVARYLEYCDRQDVDPMDISYRPLTRHVVSEAVAQTHRWKLAEQPAAFRDANYRGSRTIRESNPPNLWKQARENFRRLSGYLVWTRSAVQEKNDVLKPDWNDVADALREVGISERRSSATNRSSGEKWLPSWNEFLEDITEMEDPRCKVASLCMYGSQVSKEILVQLRRDAVHRRSDGPAAETIHSGRSEPHEPIDLFLPEGVFQQVDKALASYDEKELASGWLLPSRHSAYRRRHMASNTLVQLLEHEGTRQRIPLTCHRIQLAGALNAVKNGENPEDVFVRLREKPWRGELAVLLGTSRKPSS